MSHSAFSRGRSIEAVGAILCAVCAVCVVVAVHVAAVRARPTQTAGGAAQVAALAGQSRTWPGQDGPPWGP